MNRIAPITAKQVRNLMAIGLKSDEELHPDFPGDGSKIADDTDTCSGKFPVTLKEVFVDIERRFFPAK